jgi:hypothetical protein
MEHLWNDTDREDPKYLEKDLLQCHIFYLESQKYTGIEARTPLREADD